MLSRYGFIVLSAAALASLLIAPASTVASMDNSAAEPLAIVGDRIVGGVRVLSKLARATEVFGTPDTTRRLNDYDCRAVWRSTGLTLEFLDLSGAADPCRVGGMVTATATSTQWRTRTGLRVGDRVARIRRLYRHARHVVGAPYPGWWLITRRTCATTGSQAYPGLRAKTSANKVSALVVVVAACE